MCKFRLVINLCLIIRFFVVSGIINFCVRKFWFFFVFCLLKCYELCFLKVKLSYGCYDILMLLKKKVMILNYGCVCYDIYVWIIYEKVNNFNYGCK